MYSMNDYKAALAEREEKDFGSQSWKYAQAKVQAIAAILVATGNEEMVAEIVEELYSMNDSGFSFLDPAVQYDLWLLERNGYEEKRKEFTKLGW